LEKIARNARRLVVELEELFLKLAGEEVNSTSPERLSMFIQSINDGSAALRVQGTGKTSKDAQAKVFEHYTKLFVAEEVNRMLEKLYADLYDAKEKQRLPDIVRRLYKSESMVGPVGERPIHVCALLAARFMGEPSGKFIAEGIVRGMQRYIEVENDWEATKLRKLELMSPYGKDYCAVVSNYINTLPSQDRDINSLKCQSIPFFRAILTWYNWRRPDQKNPSQELQRHMEAIVFDGLYEGETVIFPFIASRDIESVKWILNDCVFDSQGETNYW
jgi:hypothetical protein